MDAEQALDHFCRKINGHNPFLIPLIPEPWAKADHCFQNVDRMIVMNGGTSQAGWQFALKRFERSKILVAVHHGVWQSPDDELIDITAPNKDLLIQSKQIWFLPDSHATLLTPAGCRNGIARPSLFFPVSKGRQTDELLARLRRIEKADLTARLFMCRVMSPDLGTISTRPTSRSLGQPGH